MQNMNITIMKKQEQGQTKDKHIKSSVDLVYLFLFRRAGRINSYNHATFSHSYHFPMRDKFTTISNMLQVIICFLKN